MFYERMCEREEVSEVSMKGDFGSSGNIKTSINSKLIVENQYDHRKKCFEERF